MALFKRAVLPIVQKPATETITGKTPVITKPVKKITKRIKKEFRW